MIELEDLTAPIDEKAFAALAIELLKLVEGSASVSFACFKCGKLYRLGSAPALLDLIKKFKPEALKRAGLSLDNYQPETKSLGMSETTEKNATYSMGQKKDSDGEA